jgi:hypothetical protein
MNRTVKFMDTHTCEQREWEKGRYVLERKIRQAAPTVEETM